MHPRIPEKNKRPGLCYALTGDGVELPVIDITHPAFVLGLDENALRSHVEAHVRTVKLVR